MARIMCEERGCKFFVPENQFLVDNAGMIAFLGEIMFVRGLGVSGNEFEELDIMPRERTDDVTVSWK
jgi:tRNA A37 threonylcarbamoyltransferase TsaD